MDDSYAEEEYDEEYEDNTELDESAEVSEDEE
jgi:hypothetical protein